MKYVSPEYQQQLDALATSICPKLDIYQEEFNFDGYAEIADVIIERPEIAQLGRTATFGWDSEGRYLEDER